MLRTTLFFALICCTFAPQHLYAQDATSDMVKDPKQYKNTIRVNITNPLIFGKSFVVGYERVVNEHQSFSVNLGRTELPNFFNFSFTDSLVSLQKGVKNSGFHMTADYRFYLASENKYPAGRGVYVGPYTSFVTMSRENTWTLNTNDFQGDVKTDLKFQNLSVGVQLGYQFVIWKRVALDFVLLGPGVGFYNLETKLDTDLSADDESMLFEKINDILEERFPAYNFAFDGSFKRSGSAKTTSVGYRYVIHLGFRF